MKKSCYYLAVFFALLFSGNQNALCQYYTSGTDPGSLKWRQIHTPHFRLIYPLSFETHAQYIANGLEYAFLPVSRTIHGTAPKMPVILHNQTTIPSSATPYAPRRMDFYTAPPQDLYPQDWVDQLIIHEFRHAAQYSAVNHGFTKVMSYILGQQGTFASVAFFLPLWFIEGDATVAETALHYTGRGRTPSFEMRLRAQFVEKDIYSYEKANGGSYHDFIPGKYELGYQLVGLSRDIYGAEIWGNVLNNVGRRPYTLVPFSSAIKRQTGFSKYGLYDTLTHVMQNNWRNKEEKIHENNYQVLSTNKNKTYTSYNLPVILRDSLIIAVKSSLDELTKVVQIGKDGKERKLYTSGFNFMPESFSTSDSLLYWSEMTNDPRWTMRDYRVIKSFNYNTGKVRQITNCTRYYAPSVSPDGRYLATAEVTTENNYYLTILNAKEGSIVKQIGTPENLLFIHPKWANDGKSIVSIVFGKEGNNIAIVDPGTSRLELLLSYSYMEIKRPSFWHNFIIYTASYNGTDNIYALDRSTHDIFQVTSARFGASDACVTNDKMAIIYSNYTSDGYEIAKEMLDPATWIKISVPVKSAFPLAEKLTLQENFIYNADSVSAIPYESKPYRKIPNLINFHSWVPLGIDMENISVSPGITLLSQNLLGTAVTTAGYLYDRNQKNGKYFFSMTDESLYPAIDFSFDYGKRHDLYVNNLNDTISRRWKELNLSAGLRLPLKWTHNFWIRTFQPAISLSYKYLRMDDDISLDFDHDKIITTNYSLTAINLMKTSLRDIYPRWGQQLQVNFNDTPFGNGINKIISGQVTLDFPGIVRHHGLRLYGGYQKKTENYYTFSDYIVFPRGHNQISAKEISSFSALYTMPLFYPDWQLDHFLFIKRLKSSVFYDYAKTTSKVFSSTGLDLTMDFTMFNFIAPFDAGLRSAYIPETGKITFEVLFAINLNSIY